MTTDRDRPDGVAVLAPYTTHQWTLALRAGSTYRIEVVAEGEDAALTWLAPTSVSWGGGPVQVTAAGHGSGPQTLQLTAWQDHDATLAIGSGASNPTPYRVRAIELPFDDHGDGSRWATRLSPGLMATGTIDHDGDRDTFAVSVADLVRLRVATQGPGGLTDNDVYVQAFTERGTQLQVLNGAIDLRGYAEPTVLIQVGSWQVGRDYTLWVEPVSRPSLFENPPLAAGEDRNGHLSALPSGDVQRYSVTLAAGESVELALQTGSAAWAPPGLSAWQVDGDAYAWPAWAETGLQVLGLHADQTETWIVEVSGSGAAVDFELSLSARPDDRLADSPDTAIDIAPDQGAAGRVDNLADADWYVVDLVAGQRYDIVLNGDQASTGSIWLIDEHFDPAQSTFVLNWSPLFNMLQFEPAQSGKHRVKVSGATVFDYEVIVQTLGSDDHSQNPAHATVLPPGLALDGRFDGPLDVDSFALDMLAGRGYRLTVSDTDPTGPLVSQGWLNGFGGINAPSLTGWTGAVDGSMSIHLQPRADGVEVLQMLSGVYSASYRLLLEEVTVDEFRWPEVEWIDQGWLLIEPASAGDQALTGSPASDPMGQDDVLMLGIPGGWVGMADAPFGLAMLV